MNTYWLVVLLSMLDEELKTKFKNTKGENVNAQNFKDRSHLREENFMRIVCTHRLMDTENI